MYRSFKCAQFSYTLWQYIRTFQEDLGQNTSSLGLKTLHNLVSMQKSVVIYRVYWCTFKPKLKKKKKSTLKNVSIFQKSELSSSKIKEFLTFQEIKISSCKIRKFLHFQKWNILASYFTYISGRNFPNSKNKKTALKKFLIF